MTRLALLVPHSRQWRLCQEWGASRGEQSTSDLLEGEFARELHDAWIAVACDHAEGARRGCGSDGLHVHVICDVEGFCAELEVEPLPDAEVAEDPEVEAYVSRTID